MIIGTRIYTFFYGKLIGEDEFGNRYYEQRKLTKSGKRKRWVMYNGLAEPSKVPPKWHGWLHYMTDILSDQQHPWQKQHLPNLTGTKNAYYPPGHILRGGKRDKATGDYEAWQPPS